MMCRVLVTISVVFEHACTHKNDDKYSIPYLCCVYIHYTCYLISILLLGLVLYIYICLLRRTHKTNAHISICTLCFQLPYYITIQFEYQNQSVAHVQITNVHIGKVHTIAAENAACHSCINVFIFLFSGGWAFFIFLCVCVFVCISNVLTK